MRLGVPPAFTSCAYRTPLSGQPRGFRTSLVCRASSTGQDGGFLAAGDASRPGAGGHEVKAQAQQQQSDGPPLRRGPGRPPGHPAWNKGVPMAESTRKQLSIKLKQKWKDPEYRRSVTEAMGGRQSWNAGRPHDEETRAKMAEAKLGKPKPLATRKRMSAAAMGHPVTAEVRAEVGDRFRGQPKSAEHRSKLAAAARRRHAATRVLRAVEAVYAAASSAAPAEPSAAAAASTAGRTPAAAAAVAAGSGASSGAASSAPSSMLGPGSTPPAGSSAGLGASVPAASPGPASSGMAGGGGGGGGPNMGAVRAAAYSMGLTGLSDSKTGKRLSRTQILNTFKAELREYRALQEELSTWTAAFREKNNRKPNLVDVQRTGIPWLIERFKQYVVLRDRLFSDTSVLRGKLAESLPDPESIRNANASSSSALNAAGTLGPTNANGPGSGGRSALANRFAAVMEYKMQRQGRAAAGATAAAAAAVAATPAVLGADGAEAVQQQQQGVEGPGPAPAEPAGVDQLAAKVMTSQAPPRVRLAMQAAMEYRQQKAQATKAAADAAAAAARAAGGSGGSRASRLAGSSSSRQGSSRELPQGLVPSQLAAAAAAALPAAAAAAVQPAVEPAQQLANMAQAQQVAEPAPSPASASAPVAAGEAGEALLPGEAAGGVAAAGAALGCA